MDRRIGRLVSSVMLCFSFLARAESSVALQVVDINNKQLASAGLGIPFLIEIEVISSTRDQHQHPQLTYPPSLQLVHRGTYQKVYSVNGKTEIRNFYSYQAVADQEGSLTIGPAVVDLGNGHFAKSNTVTLTVATEQKNLRATQQEGGISIVLKVGSTEPYVGQAVPFSIRFYSATDGAHLEQLQEPLFKGFKHTPLQGPVTGRATMDGVEYQYLEWKATLFPTHEGRIVIPSLLAYVTIPPKTPQSHKDMFSLVSQMFGSGRTQQVYSNALVLQVKKIPPHEPPVTAVGKFTSFHAKLSTEKAQTGEGVSLVLELVGEGNFPMIGHPALVMPEGLKYYDSHAKEHPLTEAMIKKDFEYVVQALKPGSYEIPGQTFEYFDGKAHVYKTLHSRPVTLVVTGEMRKTEATLEDTEPSSSPIVRPEELPGVEKTVRGGGAPAHQRISWPLFFSCALLFMLPLLWCLLQAAWRSYRSKNASQIGYKRAFRIARNRAKNAQRAKNESEMYHLLMDLFAARLSLPRAELSEYDIERALRKAGLSDEQLAEWRRFFAHVMAVTFSALPAEGNMYEQLNYWLTLLEQIL